MDELCTIHLLSYVMIVLGLLCFHHLTNGNKAPYGRYSKADRVLMNIQFELDARVAWFLQELPSLTVPFYFAMFTNGIQYFNYTNKLILSMFMIHYFQRWVYFSPSISSLANTRGAKINKHEQFL